MKQDWALLIGFGLVVTGCCGALAYVAAGGSDTTYTLLAGLALLVAGEVMLLILMVRQQDTYNERLATLSRNTGELRAEMRSKTDTAFKQIQQVHAENRDRTESMIGGISELKTSYSALQKSLSEKAANAPAKKPRQEPVLIAAPPAPKTTAAAPAKAAAPEAEPVSLRASIPTSLADKINFALEPVVDMRSRRTAHYRLHTSMQVGRVELEGQPLLEQVTQAGLRTQFDALAIDETLGLLSRLRQRDGDLCIILPVGPETLADEASVERIMTACEEAGDAAHGLVLEIRHSMLPLFTPRALEGLAELSRGGQAFALADASPEALDLSAMKMLHVKMVGLAAHELQHVEGLEATAQFAKQARLHGINSIVTNVTDPQLIQRLTQVTPLACGPCFASPRRVKRGAQTEDNGRKISQAA